MKYSFVLILSYIITVTSFAQEKVELFNGLEQIAPLNRIDKTFDLKKGENLIVSVIPMKGVLGQLKIDVPNSQFQLVNKKIKKLDRAFIKVDNSGTYAFHFINNNVFKIELDIKIYKQRSTIDRDTVLLEDVIFSSFIDTVKVYKDDTIPVPDLAEYSFILNPARNYGTVSDSVVFEELLKDENTEFQYAAYWVGIGAEALKAYETLKNNPPPSWLIAGMNEPLMAYGLGVTEVLPTSSSSVSRDVMFKFMDPTIYNNTDNKPKVTRRDKRADFYGRIPISSASKFKELLLSFRNFNTTTAAPIYVKFVKFKLDRVYYNQYIIRERVQEIFKEKQIEVLAPLDD